MDCYLILSTLARSGIPTMQSLPLVNYPYLEAEMKNRLYHSRQLTVCKLPTRAYRQFLFLITWLNNCDTMKRCCPSGTFGMCAYTIITRIRTANTLS